MTDWNGHAARLQPLGMSAAENGEALPVQVLEAGERALRLRSPAAVAVGRAVKAELGETMILGEVCRCFAREDGCFCVEIVAMERLSGLSALLPLIQALSAETAPEYGVGDRPCYSATECRKM